MWTTIIVVLVVVIASLSLYALPLSKIRLTVSNLYGGYHASVLVLLDGDEVMNETVVFQDSHTHTYWVVQGGHSMRVFYKTDGYGLPAQVNGGWIDGTLGSLKFKVNVMSTVNIEVDVGF